mgnify:CR=1 FL=1
MNRIIKKIPSYLLITIFMLLIFIFFAKNYVNASQDNEILSVEKKYYYNVEELNISEETVSLDSVIVTLTKEESQKFLNYTIHDFTEVGCLNIEDLTEFTLDDVKNSINDSNFCENEMIDYENFRRILKLELEDKSINGVANAIRVLMNKDNILEVSPNYKLNLTAIPNDEHYENGN